MDWIDAEALARALPYRDVVEGLEQAFREGCELPERGHHPLGRVDGEPATLLLMPAWRSGRSLGVKVVTVFPSNRRRGEPSVYGTYLLLDPTTGRPLAALDGTELTRRRTAAASALASRFLSRPESRRLLVVGTGALAPHLARAHATVRPIEEVRVWGRSPDKALRLAEALAAGGLPARPEPDLEAGVRWADVVTCATLAREPLVRGEWVRPGTHLDLVGGFTPHMREADDEAVRRAKVFVDTRAGALREAGDLVQPLRAGVISEADVEADLFDLCRGLHPGRRTPESVTLFKSVGTALEDLAAAMLAWQRIRANV